MSDAILPPSYSPGDGWESAEIADTYDPKEESNRPISLDMYAAQRAEKFVAKTEVYCYDNVCKSDGGCATCVDIEVFLPLTAQIRSITYLSTAGGPPGDTPLRPVPAGEGAWCFFSRAYQQTTPNNRVVKARFFNRSHNRDRIAALEVVYD